jgi:hypothetical protein
MYFLAFAIPTGGRRETIVKSILGFSQYIPAGDDGFCPNKYCKKFENTKPINNSLIFYLDIVIY